MKKFKSYRKRYSHMLTQWVTWKNLKAMKLKEAKLALQKQAQAL